MTEHINPVSLRLNADRWRLLALGLAAAALLAVIASTPAGHATRQVAAPCAGLDAAATAALAGLLGDPSAAAESRARDALFRLQRARKNCRLGLEMLARQDYAAIARQHSGSYKRHPGP